MFAPVQEHQPKQSQIDFFNAFKVQGLNRRNASGISSMKTSAKAPQSIQVKFRLFW